MSASLIDSLVPPKLVLSDGFRFEILNQQASAFRSSTRLHLWSGGIYRDIGLAFDMGLGAEEILAIVAAKHGAPETVLALHRLTRASIVRHGSGNRDPRNHGTAPEVFGDPAAPYRTLIAFERRGNTAGTHGPGYYVYGRGRNVAVARTGCLAEAAERKSIHVARPRQIARIPAAKLGQAAVLPRSLLNPGEPGFDEEPVDWTAAYSVASGRIRYVPAAYCFTNWNRGTRIVANSTGCAAGPNAAAAALNGFFELVERDALRGWWLSGKPGRPVRTQDFESAVIDDVRRYLWGRGRRLFVLDITTVPQVPAFVALSFRSDGRGGVMGASAHFDALTAITSATLEMGLALNWSDLIRYGSRSLIPEIGPEWQGGVDWTRPRNAGDYPSMSDPDSTGLARATGLMQDLGRDFLAVDLTWPGATFATVRVIVPGLRCFNPGTMYRLVEIGYRLS